MIFETIKKTSNKFDKNPDKVISCIENHVAKEVKNEINKFSKVGSKAEDP